MYKGNVAAKTHAVPAGDETFHKKNVSLFVGGKSDTNSRYSCVITNHATGHERCAGMAKETWPPSHVEGNGEGREEKRARDSDATRGGEEKKKGREVRDTWLSLTEREESSLWQLACAL